METGESLEAKAIAGMDNFFDWAGCLGNIGLNFLSRKAQNSRKKLKGLKQGIGI